MSKLMTLWKDEEGTSAVEYALLAFLVAIVIIVTVRPLGERVREVFREVTTALTGTGGGTTPPPGT